MTDNKVLKIGELARLADIEVQTIRYYESLALLPEPTRTDSGYRNYNTEYLEHINFIKNCQELGFSLEEISDLVHHKFSKNSKGKDVKEIVQAKIDQVEDEISELIKVKQRLTKLNSSCSGKMKSSCCPIINTLST